MRARASLRPPRFLATAATRPRRIGGRTAAAEHAPARRRTCVGCRRVADPQELVRIVRGPDGVVSVGSGAGRGAWLCGPPATERCFEQAVRRRALERALRVRVSQEELRGLRAKLLETQLDRREDGDERE